MTNVEALKGLYVALGGKLTDTYNSINNGEAVGNYVITSDIICAIAQLGAIKAGRYFDINEDDDITVNAPNGVRIFAADGGDIELEAGDNVIINSAGNVNITADEVTANGKEVATVD